jgi:hypothetical protein
MKITIYASYYFTYFKLKMTFKFFKQTNAKYGILFQKYEMLPISEDGNEKNLFFFQ